MDRDVVMTSQAAERSEIAACVLDFDGVIADTEGLHAEAKRRVLDRFHIAHPPSIFDDFKGRTDVDFFAAVMSRARPGAGRLDAATLIAAKRQHYESLLPTLRLVEGIEPLIAAARARFARLGIATSATRHDFELVDRRFQLSALVDAVVTSDDTTRFKPDPEPYLVALARLGAPAARSVAIEDSPNGIRSARAAGMLVVGLAQTFRPEILTDAGATLVFDSLHDLAASLDELAP